jgi:hypothetical protein
MECKDGCKRTDGGQGHCGDCSLAQANVIDDLNKEGVNLRDIRITPSSDLTKGVVINERKHKVLKSFPD